MNCQRTDVKSGRFGSGSGLAAYDIVRRLGLPSGSVNSEALDWFSNVNQCHRKAIRTHCCGVIQPTASASTTPWRKPTACARPRLQ